MGGVKHHEALLTYFFEILDEIGLRFEFPRKLVRHDLALPAAAGVDDVVVY
jgi:hypothetical protein